MDLVLHLRRRRGGKNMRAGVLLARKISGKKVVVGWSKCKLTSRGDTPPDTFDPQLGLKIAEGRIAAFVSDGQAHTLPPSMKDKVDEFVKRCQRYFKTDNVKVAAAKPKKVKKAKKGNAMVVKEGKPLYRKAKKGEAERAVVDGKPNYRSA